MIEPVEMLHVESDTPAHNGLVYIETVGCQMNLLDSELVIGALKRQGYELTDDVAAADTVLFNTCSVRDHAEHKIYSALGRLKFSKQSRPRQVIGVLGCMAQKDQELIFQRAPHVDIVVGTGQLSEVPRLVDEARTDRRRSLAVSLARKEASRVEVAESFQSYDPLREPQMRPSPYQAFVRIMIGCDKFCTYCVVPMTRGPEQSRRPSDIVRETRVLADQGVKEITLLGQTVNSYSVVENGRRHRLGDLLAMLHDVPGILRLKFVTNYPKDMTDDLLQAVRDLPKCSRYLHVPVQSGCDEQLRLMKRGYTVDQYREMHARLKETLPDSAVSSDFIVGFCGETEESFQRSMDLIRECRFKNSFIFKYSPRPGTKAFDLLPDDVPEEVKRRRNHEMLALQNQISGEDNARFIGRTVRVLVEGLSRNAMKAAGDDGSFLPRPRDIFQPGHGSHDGTPDVVTLSAGHRYDPAGSEHESHHDHPNHPEATSMGGPVQLTGRTNCDRIVVFPGNPRLAGSIAEIAIDDVTQTTLLGRIATAEHLHRANALLPILG